MDTLIAYIGWVFNIYLLMLLIHILLSWFQLPYNPVLSRIRGFLYDACEPYLRIFRGIIPAAGGLDFSPMIAIIVLGFASRLVVNLLYSWT